MQKIEVVPRIRIKEVYYTFEEIPDMKPFEIAKKRVELAMSGINCKKEKTA